MTAVRSRVPGLPADAGRARPPAPRPASAGSAAATHGVIVTARLRLERPAPAHLPGFLAFYASPRAARLGWQRPGAEARAFWDLLDAHWSEKGFGWFALVEAATGRALGMCGPWAPAHLPEPELAWSLWQDRDEGKGLAFEAAVAARAHAFGPLGWTTAVSYIAKENLRSAALARRLGARPDGDWITSKGKLTTVWRHPVPEALR